MLLRRQQMPVTFVVFDLPLRGILHTQVALVDSWRRIC
jgi:hypothetical protein